MAVRREGHYGWLSLGTVKKAARFLCPCWGELARMVEQDAGHWLLADLYETSLEASSCAVGKRDGAILQSRGVGESDRRNKLFSGSWALVLSIAAWIASCTFSDKAFWWPSSYRNSSVGAQISARIKGGFFFVFSVPLSVFKSVWRCLKIRFSLPPIPFSLLLPFELFPM